MKVKGLGIFRSLLSPITAVGEKEREMKWHNGYQYQNCGNIAIPNMSEIEDEQILQEDGAVGATLFTNDGRHPFVTGRGNHGNGHVTAARVKNALELWNKALFRSTNNGQVDDMCI